MSEQEYQNSMVFYRSFVDAIDQLPLEEQAIAYRAIVKYALDDEILPLQTPMQKMAWTLIKPQLDANKKKRKDGKKGASHGGKGGRPKKDNNPTGDNLENPSGVFDDNPIPLKDKTPNSNYNVNNELESKCKIDNNNNNQKLQLDRNHVFFSGFDNKTINSLQEWFTYQQQYFNLKIDSGYLKNLKPMILANIEAGNDIHYSVIATMSSRNKDGSRTKGLLYQPDPVKVAKEKNLSPEERKKQKDAQLKKNDRHNILSNYCNGFTYREAYTLLYRSKETFEHYPLRVTEVITKSECDKYQIKYPTRGEWLELNCEKEKFLLTNGNFLEGDCK